MSSDTDISDPWDWSVDKVVQELCTENRSWQPRSSSMIAPDPVLLETSLRDQEVTGSVLLVDVDDNVLKEDFGIKALGRRAFIRSAIDQIRRKSAQYHAHQHALQPEFIVSEVTRSLTEFLQNCNRSIPGSAPQFGQPQISPYQVPLVDAAHGGDILASEPENKRRRLDSSTIGNDIVPRFDDPPQLDDSLQFDDDPNHLDLELINNETPGLLNTEPPTIQEVNIKKRKRIAPTLISSEIDPNRNRDIPSEADNVHIPQPEESLNEDVAQNFVQELGVTFVGKDGRKRMVPELLSEVELKDLSGSGNVANMPSQSTQKPVVSSGPPITFYLGRKKFPVDTVFYDKISIGQEIPILEDNFDFSMTRQRHSNGRRLYVHSLMKQYMQRQRITFTKNNKQFSAIIPYNINLTPRFQKPSFTLFSTSSNKGAIARREELRSWPEVDPEAKVPHTSPDGDDRLAAFDASVDLLTGLGSYDNWDPSSLEKYKYLEGGDEVLPLYGESDEENEFDGALWDEIEKERGQKLERPEGKTSKHRINDDEVNEAIDEEIAELVVKWRVKVLPKKQAKAWKLWRKSRRDKNKREEIIKAEDRRKHIENRIAKQRAEILLDIWTSKLQVRKQTRIMEVSVFEQQDLNWKISVLEQRAPPEKLAPTLSVASSKKTVSHLEDGESIISEDDSVSSDDGLDEFIVDDEIIPTIEEEQFELNLADSENEGEIEEADMSDTSLSGEPLSTPKEFSAFPVLPIQSTRSDSQALSHGFGTPQIKGEGITMPNLRKNLDNHNVSVIDLTMISSDDNVSSQRFINLNTPKKANRTVGQISGIDLTTPEKASGVKRNEISGHKSLNLNNFPPFDDPSAIAQYSYSAFEKELDYTRLLIKYLFSQQLDRRLAIFGFLTHHSEQNIWTAMKRVSNALYEMKYQVKGMTQRTFDTTRDFIQMFLMFLNGKYVPRNGVSEDLLKKVAHEKLDRHFLSFYKLCCRIEGHFRQSLENDGTPLAFSQRSKTSRLIAEDEEDEEDEDEELRLPRKRFSKATPTSEDEVLLEDTPRKKRKRPVKEDMAARRLRQQDKERLSQQEERRKKLQIALEASGQSFAENRSRIIINDAAAEDQGHIYIHEKIGQRIKQHQIDGVRFLWNQIVTLVDRDDMQGCLLAHTMGLGKTMQTITLLVAIAEAAQSIDESISSQIPNSLQVSRTLVLCPAGLTDNWLDELLIWDEDRVLGHVQKLDSSVSGMVARLGDISSWYDNGGILIIGYEMFRTLIQNPLTLKRAPPLTEKQHEEVKKHLLEGPNIIIADEAHRLKNVNSGLTQAAFQFRSKSRIALTGSPLANNVEEYHTMIEWVTPNYLGPIAEFRATYAEPIQVGLYADSLPSERRKSLKMLDVLKETLAPKVHRADMTVLKDDIPRKTEFVITIPLTNIQKEAYTTYVQCMMRSKYLHTKDGDIHQATLWSWLAVLSLLCNHPYCFMEKLEERVQDAKNGAKAEDTPNPDDSTSTDEAPVTDLNASLKAVDVSSNLIEQMTKFFTKVKNIKSTNLSYKVQVLVRILDAAKAVGDKTLVFSQSLSTLNYLEMICKKQERKMARLDGKSPIKKRQSMTKSFNAGDLEVFLISTNAGGLGLNLCGANRVVIFDFKYNPVNEEQAVGRAYRIGQLKETFVYRFIAGGTFEELVQNKTVFKTQLASRVVDKKRPVAWATKKFSEYLVEPTEVKQESLEKFKGMDPHVLDGILSSGIIRAIVQTDTFARDDNEKLTAEEANEVKQMLNDAKIRREDPEKWAKIREKRQRQSLPNQIPQANPPASTHLNKSAAAPSIVLNKGPGSMDLNKQQSQSGPSSSNLSRNPNTPAVRHPIRSNKGPVEAVQSVFGPSPNISGVSQTPSSKTQDHLRKIVSSLKKASNLSLDDPKYSEKDARERTSSVARDLQNLILARKMKEKPEENLTAAVSSVLENNPAKSQALLTGKLTVDNFVSEVQKSLRSETSFKSPEPTLANDITEVGTSNLSSFRSSRKVLPNQVLEKEQPYKTPEPIKTLKPTLAAWQKSKNEYLTMKKDHNFRMFLRSELQAYLKDHDISSLGSREELIALCEANEQKILATKAFTAKDQGVSATKPPPREVSLDRSKALSENGIEESIGSSRIPPAPRSAASDGPKPAYSPFQIFNRYFRSD